MSLLNSIHSFPSVFSPTHSPSLRAIPQNFPDLLGRLVQSSMIGSSPVSKSCSRSSGFYFSFNRRQSLMLSTSSSLIGFTIIFALCFLAFIFAAIGDA